MNELDLKKLTPDFLNDDLEEEKYNNIVEEEQKLQSISLDDFEEYIISEKDISLTKEEMEKYNNYQRINSQILKYFEKNKYIAQKREEDKVKYEEILALEGALTKDRISVNNSLVALKNWYNQHKKDLINKLQSDINKALNEFFGNNHNLKIKTDVKRGKTVVEMVEEDENGKIIGSPNMTLSDAEKQMVGFISQLSLLSDCDFAIFDEPFSSFGDMEVRRIPQILKEFDDLQKIIIEHKDGLFKNIRHKKISIDRDKKRGTYIVSEEEVCDV